MSSILGRVMLDRHSSSGGCAPLLVSSLHAVHCYLVYYVLPLLAHLMAGHYLTAARILFPGSRDRYRMALSVH